MKILFSLFIWLFCVVCAIGQTVKGVVTDTNGVPLTGVSILVQGTTTGTITDIEGAYALDIGSGNKIIFSFLGFKTQIISVSGKALINVIMEEDSTQLNEIVVTAFGIEKEKKSVGYSIQEVKSDELTRDSRGDVLASLQGKVAGVNINATSGAAGAGSSIIIRGITSLDPGANNQPLFVVDGIPISNEAPTGSLLPSVGSNAPSTSEQFSFSNRGADINPNDIESVSILKGAAATALYGLRAANGVVIITTKKGKMGDMKFNFKTSFGWDEVNKAPDVQTKYREGFSGNQVTFEDPTASGGYTYAAGNSFGFWSFGPEYVAGEKVYNNFMDFFEKGYTLSNTLNVSGGSEKMTYFGSLSRTDNGGIVPNTFFNRTNMKFNSSIKISDKFEIEPSVSLIQSHGDLPNGGDKSIMSSLSYWTPSIDVNDYLFNGEEKNYSNGVIDNPRYFAEVSNLNSKVNRIIANATLKYNIKEWIDVQYQFGVDNYHDRRRRFVPADVDAGSASQGFIVEEAINYNEFTSNLFVTLSHDFSEDLKGSLLLGNQISDIERKRVNNRAEGLDNTNPEDFSSATNFFNDVTGATQQIVGLFGDLRLEYKNTLFLNITGRNDWSSTLPKDNRSFFYPAFNLSYVFSQSLKDAGGLPDFFTFGKIRASWAEVGKDAPPFIAGVYYDRPTNFPFGSVDGISQVSTGGSNNLQPERTTSYEFGAELKFFNSRLGLDLTYYNQRSKDQILPVPVAQSSGFNSFYLNSGEIESNGLELLLNLTPIKTSNFQWDLDINWSKVESKVLSLPEGIDEIIFADSGFPGVISKLIVGGQPGDLYGYTYSYNDEGQRIISSDGFPRIDTSERVKVGSALPDWLGSVASTISWKGLALSFLLERKEGGNAYDSGQRNSIRNGVLKITELREDGIILDGVLADGTPNNIPVNIDQNYYRSSTIYNRAAEILVEDTSWWRLRNVTLSYDLPEKLLSKIPFDGARVSFTGTNLWLDTPFRGYDPEGSQFSAGTNAYGFTGLNIPNTKSFFFGLNLNF